MWKIYGKSIHLLNVQWIGRIGLYGFCSNLDCNGLIRNYRFFGGVGCVALLYYVVAWENFRRTKEIDTQQDICTKSCIEYLRKLHRLELFLVRGINILCTIESVNKLSANYRFFSPLKLQLVHVSAWWKSWRKKVTMPRQSPHFLFNWSKHNYILPSLIILEKTQYMPVSALQF